MSRRTVLLAFLSCCVWYGVVEGLAGRNGTVRVDSQQAAVLLLGGVATCNYHQTAGNICSDSGSGGCGYSPTAFKAVLDGTGDMYTTTTDICNNNDQCTAMVSDKKCS